MVINLGCHKFVGDEIYKKFLDTAENNGFKILKNDYDYQQRIKVTNIHLADKGMRLLKESEIYDKE